MAATTAFLPEKSHEERSLVGHSPVGHKELDTTEKLSMHVCVCGDLEIIILSEVSQTKTSSL